MIFIDFSFGRQRSWTLPAIAAGAVFLGAILGTSSPVRASVSLHFPPEVQGSRLSAHPDALLGKAGTDLLPNRYAQSSSRSQQDRRSREISDQEHAKDRRDRGKNKSFDELFQRARSIGRGEYLGVEPDISSNIYRFKFMRTSGQVVWVDMDGQTGRVIAERE